MGVDAVFALVAGLLYDRIGILVLGIVPFLTVGAAAALFLPSEAGLGVSLLGMVLWGGAMGLHESVLRAAVADLTPRSGEGSGTGSSIRCTASPSLRAAFSSASSTA